MLITSGKLAPEALKGEVIIITGAGGGIGFEAARALLALGARVVIAEIDRGRGRAAEARLHEEFGSQTAIFIRTDVGSQRSVRRLARRTTRLWDKVDVVIHNATVAPLGGIEAMPIAAWDTSYRVNLRGPVLLAQAFLPGMQERDHGVLLHVSSFGAGYMGAYESLKAAQVHLADTLADELRDSGVIAFTIGPGFVPTETASGSIPKLAALMGQAEAELRAQLAGQTLSVEAAGAGFAAAVAQAEAYRGQEVSSLQALLDAGITPATVSPTASPTVSPEKAIAPAALTLTATQWEEVQALLGSVRDTLAEQSEGWQERSVFERQWMVRAFRKHARMSVPEWLAALDTLAQAAQAQDSVTLLATRAPLEALAGYYAYLFKMAQGYLKDPAEREEQLGIVRGWQDEVERLATLVST